MVREEIRAGSETRPGLLAVDAAPWLNDGGLDDDGGLLAFMRWSELIGARNHDCGEASMFAFAEINGATSIIDDREATVIGRAQGLTVHGSLWLISEFYNAGKLTAHAARRLVDDLRAVGARLPCTGSDFLAWARKHGLLPKT